MSQTKTENKTAGDVVRAWRDSLNLEAKGIPLLLIVGGKSLFAYDLLSNIAVAVDNASGGVEVSFKDGLNFPDRYRKEATNDQTAGEATPSVERESTGASAQVNPGEQVRRTGTSRLHGRPLDDNGGIELKKEQGDAPGIMSPLRCLYSPSGYHVVEGPHLNCKHCGTHNPPIPEAASEAKGKSLYWHGLEPTAVPVSTTNLPWAPKCPRCESPMNRTNVHEDPEPGWVCSRAACGAMLLDKDNTGQSVRVQLPDDIPLNVIESALPASANRFANRGTVVCECPFPVRIPQDDGSSICAKCNKPSFKQKRTRKLIHTHDNTFDRYSYVSIETSETVDVSGQYVTIGGANPTLLKWPGNFQVEIEEAGSHRALAEIHINPVQELLKAIAICRGPVWAAECRAIWEQVQKAMREREAKIQAEEKEAKAIEAKSLAALTQVRGGILNQGLSFCCSKCGSGKAVVHYHKSGRDCPSVWCPSVWGTRVEAEHLHVVCSVCSFDWTRVPLDQSAPDVAD